MVKRHCKQNNLTLTVVQKQTVAEVTGAITVATVDVRTSHMGLILMRRSVLVALAVDIAFSGYQGIASVQYLKFAASSTCGAASSTCGAASILASLCSTSQTPSPPAPPTSPADSEGESDEEEGEEAASGNGAVIGGDVSLCGICFVGRSRGDNINIFHLQVLLGVRLEVS